MDLSADLQNRISSSVEKRHPQGSSESLYNIISGVSGGSAGSDN